MGGVDIICWPLLFGSPNAVFPHLNSNNFQPLSNGFLSNETNFQMHFIEDSWFEILYMYFKHSAFVKPVWNYVGIDTAVDLLRRGFHLFHLYVKIKKNIEDLNIH